jgi:tRNA dimethylallyltransferase
MTGRHVAVVGTTASGKSALAFALARRHPDLEIVSIDSMQVYRGMDIGTAKPAPAERAEVPHHLIDLVDPDEEFTVAQFQREFVDVLAGIEARRHRALLVGGTGLYLRAAIDRLTIPGRYPHARRALDEEPTDVLHERLLALDPVGVTRVTPANRRRIVRALEVTVGSGRPFSSFGPGLEAYPPTPFVLAGIALPPGVVAARIEARYRRQLDDGFVDEVRRLLARPRGLSRTAGQALGYKELAAHLAGHVTRDEAIEQAVRRTRQFARRQRAWLRRDPRIDWLRAETDPFEVWAALEQIVSGAAA